MSFPHTPFHFLFCAFRSPWKGKNSHAWIMNLSSWFLGEASDAYQFSIFHWHLRHSICIYQTTGSFFCIGAALRKCQNVWEWTALKFSHLPNIIQYELNWHGQIIFSSVLPVRAVLMLTGWKPPLRAEESMMSESKSRWFFRYTKRATMTEMTKHMITAMTMPT